VYFVDNPSGSMCAQPPSPSFLPPSDYTRIKVVASFQELVTTPFKDGVNALCWPRALAGDFREIVEKLGPSEGITPLDATRLNVLTLSEAGRIARDILLEDQRLLRERGLTPELNYIQSYPRDKDPAPVPIDVYSFHADSAPIEADTYLCTYHGAASEGLRNDEAQRRVDVPTTRAELLKLFGGKDDDDFLGYLNENCYDLHYAPAAGARPFSFGLGNFWRIALDYPGNPVPPCVHRAPDNLPGQPARLLLIS
jgi:hypothetical protein